MANTAYSLSLAALLLPLVAHCQALDIYGGRTDVTCPSGPSGHFYTAKINKRWWLCDALSHPMWVNSVNDMGTDDSVNYTGESYTQAVTAKYGDPNYTWSNQSIKRLLTWGFNAVSEEMSTFVMPFGRPSGATLVPAEPLFLISKYSLTNNGAYASDASKDIVDCLNLSVYSGFAGHSSPETFDPVYQTFISNWTRAVSLDSFFSGIETSPYTIGYTYDDSDELFGLGPGPDHPGFNGIIHPHTGWIAAADSPVKRASAKYAWVYQNATVYSKKQLQSELETTYASIAALNTSWGSFYTTFGTSGTCHGSHFDTWVCPSPSAATSIGTGDGTTLTFSTTLTTAVSKDSIGIFVAGAPVGGDDTGNIFGPNASGTINYSTGALSITFTAGNAPASGAAITAEYISNGWGIGTGFLDENGSHTAWLGNTDGNLSTDASPGAITDLNAFLLAYWQAYFSVQKTARDTYLPNVMIFTPTLDGDAGATRPQILQAAAQYADVMAISTDTQTLLDISAASTGDKPYFYDQRIVAANPDSGFFQYDSPAPFTEGSQADRGAYYLSETQFVTNAAVTSTGVHPIMGATWWAWVDSWAEKADWGLVTVQDNSYNGVEDCVATGTDQWGFAVGGERDVPSWQASTSYTGNGGTQTTMRSLVQASTGGVTYEWSAQTSGTSGLSAPNWASATAQGQTVVDGGVTWANSGIKHISGCFGNFIGSGVSTANSLWLSINANGASNSMSGHASMSGAVSRK